MYNYLFVRLATTHDLVQTPVDWLLTDTNGKVAEFTGKPELLSDIQARGLEYRKLILIIPDHLVSYNLAEIPIKDKAKRAQAAKFILEDNIVSNIENTAFIIGPEVNPHQFLVAATDSDKLVTIVTEFKNLFNVTPFAVLTDALCLFNPHSSNYSLYLNQTNDLALIISKNIVVTYFKNLKIVFNQIINNSDARLNVDIYRHGIANLNEYLSVDKCTVTSEQEITEWLPFLAKNWFITKQHNKINLASNFVKQNKLDLHFSPLWKHIAIIWTFIMFSFIAYKYIDNKVYSERAVELNALIKKTLSNINIKSTDLNNAELLINRQISRLEEDAQKERASDEFKVLLGTFATTFIPALKINYMTFKNHKLEINFTFNKDKKNYLDSTKSSLAEQNITLAESIKDQDNVYNVTWTMGL